MKKLLELLGDLDGAMAEYPFDMNDGLVLVGSAVLAVRGIRDVRDLDVLASPEVFAYLKGCEPADQTEDEVAFRSARGVIQIGTKMVSFAKGSSLTAFDVRQGSRIWQKWRVMSLEHLKDFKRAVGRQKDLEDLQLIRRWCNNHQPNELPRCKCGLAAGLMGGPHADECPLHKP